MSSGAGRFSVCVLLALGTAGIWMALRRGGLDFDVFATASHWVLQGDPSKMYSENPDRYLYAPGFAWIFSPMALFPRNAGLIVWTLLKLACLAWVLRPWLHRGAGLALLCLARPILIDFQYGQLNLLLLAAALWVATESESKRSPWFFLSLLAWAKLYLLPLLVLPWIRGTRGQKLATLAGSSILLGLPFFFAGFEGASDLYADWFRAIGSRGIPLESHNQSLIAFLTHLFGGTSLRVIFAGPTPISFGHNWLAPETIDQLALAASLFVMGVWTVRALRLARSVAPFEDWAILISLLIVPLHLIWKPYFIFGLPMTLVLFSSWNELARKFQMAVIAVAFLYNFTGFDFLGPTVAAWLEASALFFWLHLTLIYLVWVGFKSRQLFPSRSLASS